MINCVFDIFQKRYMDNFEKGLDFLVILCYNTNTACNRDSLFPFFGEKIMETYRSGHNGADSKSVREQSPASSNLAVCAKESQPFRAAIFFRK